MGLPDLIPDLRKEAGAARARAARIWGDARPREMGREEALRLTGRFELLHLPLSSACRLVRILRSVIESLVLAMVNAGHDLPLCRAVAGKLVGDHDTGRPHLPLQQLAEQPLGRLLVAPALDENLEHDAGLV